MTIKFQCGCGQSLSVPDTMAGKTGKCPKCQKALKVPAPASSTATAAKPAAAAPVKSAAAPSKPAAKPAAAATAPSVKPAPKPAPAPAPMGIGGLLDEVGLKQKTGPVCPKCGADIKPGTVMCIGCGLNFATGEQTLGYAAQIQEEEFKNPFLREAAENMSREVVADVRRDKAGTPWWVLLSFLMGAMTLCGAGVIIVDGIFNEAPDPSTPMGRLQMIPVLTVLGITALLTANFINFFAHLSITIFGFRRSWGAGFGCLLVPMFDLIYGIMHWADNKAAVKAIFIAMFLGILGTILVVLNGMGAAG